MPRTINSVSVWRHQGRYSPEITLQTTFQPLQTLMTSFSAQTKLFITVTDASIIVSSIVNVNLSLYSNLILNVIHIATNGKLVYMSSEVTEVKLIEHLEYVTYKKPEWCNTLFVINTSYNLFSLLI